MLYPAFAPQPNRLVKPTPTSSACWYPPCFALRCGLPRALGPFKTMPSFANTPEPPYYAVIFSSQRTEGDHGYSEMATRMVELAGQQVGFLGAESTRDSSGFGITVSYWASESAIKAWKANIEHLAAQEQGRSSWYAHFKVRVNKVERAYAMG